MTTTDTLSYQKKDFVTSQEVRWCPGCGDYAILTGVQQVFAALGVAKENFVFVSGIGCSSRFPYYVDTYGFHGIHGRAAAIATGVKCANPELDVWVATGDGDALSIGGNHMIHAARRNVDMTVLLFNNRIYGLTKGQYSPTSERSKKTISTPFGSLDTPFNPVNLMLGAGATFVARTVDTQLKHLKGVLEAAHAHRGFSLVEILQNCVIFNHGAFEHIAAKQIRDDRQVDLIPGKPMIFGKDLDKGLKLQPTSIEIVSPEEATVWNPAGATGANAYRMSMGDERGLLPVPIGILRSVERPVIDRDIHEQIAGARERLGDGSLTDMFQAGDTWKVG